MFEALLVLGGLVAIGLIALITVTVTPPVMVGLGFMTLVAGLLVGVPTGAWYHVVLYRTLARRMTLPRRWWRKPVDLHPLLTPQEYQGVRPWFLIGAAGFLLCLVGGIAAIAGFLMLALHR